ncbi:MULTISPECIES: entericidin A/B family lipoprotein [unclassified Brevundimonas]|nr:MULTISPECIES: entericidin A/B family lipoprotein [unclassified Brevundimonas]
MRKIIALSAIAIALATAACNTVAGIGRDVQAAGRAVTNSSDSARR